MDAKCSRRLYAFYAAGLLGAVLLTAPSLAQNPILGPPTTGPEPPAPIVRMQQGKDEQPKPGNLPPPGKGAPAKQDKLPQPGKDLMPEKRPMDKIDAEIMSKGLPAPTLESGEEGLVINLPTALRLANARAWDITIAIQQLQIADAQRLGADVLWLPTLTAGSDYQYHSGPTQNTDGTTTNTSRDSIYSGGSPLAIFALTDAIFTPLAARQVVRAQDANIQTARNDTLTDLATAYFDLLEAQADLASIVDVDRRAGDLVAKVDLVAPEFFPDLEKARVRALKYNIEQVVEVARQRWRVASAEVARIARLKPTVVLQPLEPPHIRMTLVSPNLNGEQMIEIGLTTRPELTFYEAQVAAARDRERQEKWRPFLPTLIARGGGTTPPYPMAFGSYGSGIGSSLNNYSQRSDWDVSLIWTLQNMGAGNIALIRERKRETELAASREYRFRDVVAREVMVAWADVRSADRRYAQAERELVEAERSARQNIVGVSELKRPQGQINIPVVRPQEVVQALQALNAAYFNYYGVVAEYNRAQFRLYRAMGSPAQMLEGHESLGGPLLKK